MNYEDLEVWERSTRLSVKVYKTFSNSRDYGFKDQITRSSLSVPSNIAEGFGRTSDKEKRNFLNIARGSCAELHTQLLIGSEIGYIDQNISKEMIKEAKEISSMISGLMKCFN